MAEAALPHAATLALVTSSVLQVVTVIEVEPHETCWVEHDPSKTQETPESGYAHAANEAELQDAREYLASVQRRVATEGLEIECEVLEGDPAASLVRHAECDPAITMIAMTTHGQSGPGRWPLGGITERVLSSTDKPLLLVHPEGGIWIPLACSYHVIVVPLDGSLLAEGALDRARTLARCTGAAMLLVSVVSSPDDMGLLPSGVHLPVSMPAWQAEVEDISCYLQRTARAMCKQAPGLAVQIQVVAGHPADAIIDMSNRTQADLIVMSTHGKASQHSKDGKGGKGGKGGQAHSWLGSVALKVVQGARSPVLLLRSKELNDLSQWVQGAARQPGRLIR